MRLVKRLIPASASALMALLAIGAPAPVHAQANNPCLGELMLFGGNYCPQGYVEAAGGTLSVQQYAALFSLYGTMYGGDGRTTFGIPDLRGRAPVSQGQGPGLPNYMQGELTGSTTTTIQQLNLPAISPTVNAVSGPAQIGSPNGLYLSNASSPTYGGISGTIPAKMAPNMISPLGNGVPMTTQNPIQAIRWCVAVQGIYCSRQ